MVAILAYVTSPMLAWQVTLLAEEAIPARLDGATRAKMLVILGFGGVLLIWMGARMTRRYMHSGGPLLNASPMRPDDWAEKPLRKSSKPKPQPPTEES